MRHFSHTSTDPIVSYNISDGEYSADIDTAYRDTLRSLAVAMEVSYLKALEAIRCYTRLDSNLQDSYCPEALCPAEWRTILELLEFHKVVLSGNYWSSRSMVFTYVNLNTGKSTVWVHVIA